MNTLAPYQLLEINVISAQDLAKMSRSMKTYALAWVHPDRKLTTRVDENGSTNPTWNDKFVFRVDNQFLQSDTSAIMIEIYAIHWFRDVLVGTVRVLVGNLVPPQTRGHNANHIGMRFVALQVRRPSGRPKGILNVGVTVLNSTKRSMPLYEASAVGYQTLMGKDELRAGQGGNRTPNGTGLSNARFRRSHSEKSSMVDFIKPNSSTVYVPSNAGSSMVGYEDNSMYDKPLSIVDGANPSLAIKLKAQKGKADSVIGFEATSPSTAKWEEKRRRRRGKKGGSSVASKSDVGSIPPMLRKINPAHLKGTGPKKPKSDIGAGETSSTLSHEMQDVIMPTKHKKRSAVHPQQGKSPVGYQRGGYPKGKDFTAGSVWTESEVGPSPSEVAAAIAEDRKYRQNENGRSSMLDDKWSVADSEGVMTKLERWRTQIPPPQYEDDDIRSSVSGASSLFPKPQWRRRHAHKNHEEEEEEEVASSGKFSCFSNICGYECTIVCGQDNPNHSHNHNRSNKQRRHRRARRPPPSSVDTASTYF